MMVNVFDPELIQEDAIFKDVEEDIRLELDRFGTVEELYIPRPILEQAVQGLGRVFIEFDL